MLCSWFWKNLHSSCLSDRSIQYLERILIKKSLFKAFKSWIARVLLFSPLLWKSNWVFPMKSSRKALEIHCCQQCSWCHSYLQRACRWKQWPVASKGNRSALSVLAELNELSSLLKKRDYIGPNSYPKSLKPFDRKWQNLLVDDKPRPGIKRAWKSIS